MADIGYIHYVVANRNYISFKMLNDYFYLLKRKKYINDYKYKYQENNVYSLELILDAMEIVEEHESTFYEDGILITKEYYYDYRHLAKKILKYIDKLNTLTKEDLHCVSVYLFLKETETLTQKELNKKYISLTNKSNYNYIKKIIKNFNM